MPHYDADWFKSALNAMHDKVLIKGTASEILWANTAFLELYGMTEDELFELVDADHSDPDDTLQYVIDDQTVVDSGQHLEIPQEIVRNSDGVGFHLHTVKSPIFEGDQVVRTVGVSRNLTIDDSPKRDFDQANAKAFVAPLKALTRSFPNPMMMVDVKARVIHTNALWDAVFGGVDITPNSYFLTAYEGFDALSQCIGDCMRTNSNQHITMSLPKEGLARHVYTVQVSPWAFENGTMGGATIIATDVSALHQQSAALQSANDELMQYAYRASHDLKGPIMTVKGLASLIIEDVEAGETAEALESARAITIMMERLENNVKSILDLARADLEDGQSSAVDLHAMLGEICDGLSANLARSGVQVENRLHVQHMQSQPTRLRQILENLIANSVRYHAPERLEKYVRVRSSETEESVAIDIEDNGLGIPDDAGDRIFERFTRFSRNSEGSGLGLAIVKRNVDALSGRIDVQSSDAGTAIRVVVPKTQPEEERT